MNNEALKILKHYWGYDSFRPIQNDIVNAVIQNKSVLALLPTGGGKSICFQIPALIKPGICIVISPLLSLMRDQVTQLKKKKIKAEYIHAGLTGNQIDTILDNCIYGDVKFLYLSPERIQSALVSARISKMQVNLIAIDEAHCISQWGHDFRPSYQKINSLISLHLDVPVIALTATATKKVSKDIINTIDKKEIQFFKSSFQRQNINYNVFREENKPQAIIQLIKKINGSGIVYLRSRKNTEKYAKLIQEAGIDCDYYHAGCQYEDKKNTEQEWMTNKIKVVVCTNAFGMGIDKPDVRFVIHGDVPANLEEYYQESGRAGRDGKPSKAIIIYNQEDIDFQKVMLQYRFPTKVEINHIYQSIGNHYKIGTGDNIGKGFPFDIYKFSNLFKYEPLKVFNTIKILEKEGYLFLSDNELQSSKLMITCNEKTLNKCLAVNDLLAKVLNTILRSYTGLFSDFVKIQEHSIAESLNITEHTVKNILQQLSQKNILHYYLKQFLPVLIYTKQRVPTSHLTISQIDLTEKKKIAESQLNSMIDFVKESDKCRTNIALFYFGEQPKSNCGHCDNCLKEIKEQDIEEIIINILRKEPLNLNELIIRSPNSKEHTIQTVRLLLENKIIERKGQLLHLITK